jgi:uncharacterized protein (TIGR03083 family)
MTRDDILAQIDASWTNLTDAIPGIPADRFAEPGVCGDWTVKDLLGHVAFWDRVGADHAARELAGEPKPDGESDWPVDQILTELETAHRAFLDAYRALPNLRPAHVQEDWEHYDEHAAEIRSWRKREGT